MQTLKSRIAARGDSGQTLLIVIVIIALLASAAAVMASTVDDSFPNVTRAADERAAYAAVESGIQAYRSALNNDLATASVAGNGVVDAWETPAAGVVSYPAEAWYITPNTGLLGSSSTATYAGDVLATITGKGGTTDPVYESVVIAYKQYATYLQNAYYSELEVLDPNYPESATSVADQNVSVKTVTGTVTTTVTEPESEADIDYTYVNDAGTSVTVSDVSIQSAMCDYEGYQENTFIDSMDSISATNLVSGKDFSTTTPYYGAYFGIPSSITTQATTTQPALENSDWQEVSTGANDFVYSFTPSAGTTETLTLTKPPCATPYDFLGGENFTGPVYSADELHVCGASGEPDFSGSPISLLTGTPTSASFKYEWPGSIKGSGSLAGLYVPAGYTLDPDSCASGPVNPTLGHGIEEGVNEILPTFDNSLSQYTAGATGGCLFTGPTMIELVYSGGAAHMDVWSPLSKQTDMASTSATACGNGQFSPTNAWVTGIALPTDGVVYVQNVPLATADPNYWSSTALDALNSSAKVSPSDGATSTSCFVNPEETAALPDSTTCTNGTAFVEGELYGQVTIGADSDIYITRDLTYSCADTATAVQSLPATSLPAACSTETTPDLLGLYANGDILWSHPQTFSGTTGTNAAACPANVSVATNDAIGNVEPTCTTSDGIVDALLIALQGSFGIQYYDQGATEGTFNLYGADVAYYRGPFGVSGSHGYTKQFNYDERLSYLSPPHAVEATSTNWYPFGWVSCGGYDLAGLSQPACSGPA